MEDKKIIENDSQLIVGVNEKISCGKAAFLGMQHVLSMDLYIMPLILGAAIGLAGGELSFFLQMSFFACGIATILQAGFFMKYPIIQGPSYVPLGALCTIGATMGVSAMIGSLIPGAIMIILLGIFKGFSKFVRKAIPPFIGGIIILIVGISLTPTAAKGIASSDGNLSANVASGLTAAGVLIVCMILQYKLKHNRILHMVSVILALVAGTVVAAAMGAADFRKSSSKADGKNRGMSTSKGRVESERSITCEGGSTTIDDVTGMDWYNYYRDTYGKENVCWESCNPSEVASAWQGSYPYTGVDAYTNITLHDGDIIYMGEPFPTGYSTTSEVAQTIGNDAQKVFGGLQVKPYYEKGMAYAEYRSKLTPYKVHGELNVADGVALNNPQFGQGGLTQRFDPNFDFNCANGVLEKLDNQTISLTNTKISLEEYFGMMNEIK